MIDVLLATYRPDVGWLREQLDSIRAQVGMDVNPICREDVGGLGARGAFSDLLSESKADYAAFSDQDDVWHSDKLAKCLDRMKALESQFGRKTPALVFCDGLVTDRELNPCSGTVISRQRVDVEKGISFRRLLMQNFIAGNAMLINAALREKAGVIPADALMHDSWLALVAAAFGHIGFVDEPLYCYRQHQANVLGATSAGCRHFLRRAIEGRTVFRERLRANIRQARAFVERFGAESPDSAVALAQLDKKSFFARRVDLVRHRLYKHGVLRNLALFACV